MRGWHHDWRTDIGMRAGGVALCGAAWLAVRTLAHLRFPSLPASPGPLAFALAFAGFVTASAGTAMLALGHHLFDQVEVSERWRPHRPVTGNVSDPKRRQVPVATPQKGGRYAA